MNSRRKPGRVMFLLASIIVRNSDAFGSSKIPSSRRSLRRIETRRYTSSSVSENEDPLQKYLQKAEEAAIQEFAQTEAPSWLQDLKSLPFECTACGRCCRTKGHVYLSPEEILQAAQLLDMSQSDFIDQYASHILTSNQQTWIRLREQDDSCIFLDVETNQCQIYEARPTQCRTYPFWPNLVQSPDSWNAECRSQDDDTKSPLPKWTAKTGGCEGMELIDTKNHETGVAIQDAIQQLYEYIREERRFPKEAEQQVAPAPDAQEDEAV